MFRDNGVPQVHLIEDLTDTELIAKAQDGEREAFGELFRRHHAKAYGVARSIVQDTYTADDIVQEALIKAFLHLGTLMDAERFLPWLHRIVRNQAYTRLKTLWREQPLTRMFGLPASGRDDDSFGASEMERLIDRLRRRDLEPSDETDPAVRLARCEWYETIRQLLLCLSKRERAFFESYFFEQLSPKEIADLYRTTTGNVYMVLSRSKKKLMEERIRRDLDRYISHRRLGGTMEKMILKKPRVLHWKSPFSWSYEPWTTAGFNMYGILETTDKHELSISQVLGLTSQAFRLNIVRNSIHTSGATRYDWNVILPKAMYNLGFQCRVVSGGSAAMAKGAEPTAHASETLEEAFKLIQETVDRGGYVLSFDLTLPEFGIIYGYDDNSREFYVGDVNVSFHRKVDEHERLPYNRLGRTVTGELFVMAITGTVPVTKEGALLGALRLILDHANGKESVEESCANGLSAYEAWIDAFRNRTVDKHGNSYTTELAHDARRYAVRFLEETASEWEGTKDNKTVELLIEAARHYALCAESFQSLCEMFPFDGERSTPNDSDTANRAIVLLQDACDHEHNGISVLERLSDHLQQVKTSSAY
ncbi:RNA polymerase sigma factor [Paenibacillus eucommiae]|uniref:RNA polymerase sigma factor n=1 Tax=Paenibacillus eucommiae TaxID=1355755 RepID=A0ABS4IPY1_9BACL|nr:RNA polymerase sigma factor [Paenibacillus eucommiae]MBP1989628.1 RNA polymerase sigma factor (sigma-70 family) [Paenibacillus eucommiae]